MDANEALGLLRLGLDENLRAVLFNPDRRSEEFGPDSDTPTNGERATDGKTALALFCALDPSIGPEREVLDDIAGLTNLAEAPEEALATMLTDLMHYCHRDGVSFSEALVTAVGHFHVESGGAHV